LKSSSWVPFGPVPLPFKRNLAISRRKACGLLPETVKKYDPPTSHEKVEHPSVQSADVAQFEKIIPKGFGKRRPVVNSPPQPFKACQDCNEIIRVGMLKIVKEIPHRATARICLIELYVEFHVSSTSILMLEISS
jgi:hypothetical protein